MLCRALGTDGNARDVMCDSGADRQREERTDVARVQRQEWPPVAHQGL